EPWTRNGCSSTGTSIEGSLKVQAGAETCELIMGIVTEDEEGTHGHMRRRDPTTTDLGIKHEQGADHHGHVHERTMLTTYTKAILVATEQATTMTQTITLAPRRGECVSQVECNHRARTNLPKNISARREDELEGRRKTVKMKDGEDDDKGNEGG
ncbi:hypothetical protein BDN71DRAFT_1573842, partial [Pleurotus eryngii]